MDAEETYLKNYTNYGVVAYEDDEVESDHEYDQFEEAEAKYGR